MVEVLVRHSGGMPCFSRCATYVFLCGALAALTLVEPDAGSAARGQRGRLRAVHGHRQHVRSNRRGAHNVKGGSAGNSPKRSGAKKPRSRQGSIAATPATVFGPLVLSAPLTPSEPGTVASPQPTPPEASNPSSPTEAPASPDNPPDETPGSVEKSTSDPLKTKEPTTEPPTTEPPLQKEPETEPITEPPVESDPPSTQKLFWSEEFNGPAGSSPDPNNWNFDIGGKGWGDEELESYTSRPANVELDGKGDLDITARAEDYTGSDGRSPGIHLCPPADAAQVSFPVRLGGGAHPGAGLR